MADNSNAAAAQHRMNTPQLSSNAGHEDAATAAVAAGCTAVAANGSTAAYSATNLRDLRPWPLAAFVSLQHKTGALLI
jgi:pyruvate/2-oxoacid:ferredoxin oxidoreductase alpha subunit